MKKTFWITAIPATIRKTSLIVILLSLHIAAIAGVGSGGPTLLGDNFYYTFNNGKIVVYKVQGKYLVEYPNGLYSNTNSSGAPNYPAGIRLPHNRFLVTDTSNLDAYGAGHFVTPAYRTAQGKPFYYAKEIVLQFNKGVSATAKNSIESAYGLALIKTTPSYDLYKVQGDGIEIAKSVYESGTVRFCTPNFLARLDKFEYTPNDPYYINQWYLRNTGQEVNGKTGISGADIKVVPAWDNTRGSADIIIAVIDQGVTSNHPDLPNSRQVRLPGSNLAYLYDGTNNPNDPSPTVSITVPYNHGNAVAGIIAAQHNTEGIAGIAPDCRIMPIKIELDENIVPVPQNVAADAINFALENDADIISCSWGIKEGSQNEWPVLVAAIKDVLNNGITVLYAIGNDAEHKYSDIDGDVAFPANNKDLINLGMIAVGASTRHNTQANYSPYGENISVVAPSHTAYWNVPAGVSPTFVGEGFNIWTLDIPDDEGYNPWKHFPGTTDAHVSNPNGNPAFHNDDNVAHPNTGANNLAYTAYFGGTSAATPMVAGVAALMLSVNPCLGNGQVKDILQSTTDKLPGYDYNQNPARPGQSKELGYGKINAEKAVDAAIKAQSATLDLYIKDNPNDIGTTGPDGTGGGGDQSPDIWVRNSNDGIEKQEHEAPEYQNFGQAYVYVKVRNKSCAASTGTEMLRLYWHYASAGGTGWPGGWDGSTSQGGLVGEEMIPSLKPGEETVVPFAWQMDPALEDAPNACLLARIEDVAADPIDDSYPDTETHLLISQNNNVAIKNITIINNDKTDIAPAPGFVGVFNESLLPRNYNLHIRVPGWGNGFAADITSEAEVKIKFDPAGWDILMASGNVEQEGVKLSGDKELTILQPDITFHNLGFEPGAAMPMQVQFNFLTDRYTENKTYQLAFSALEPDGKGGTAVLGTETFIINKHSRDIFDADAGSDKSVYPQATVQLSAKDINEAADYKWYDMDGNLVYSGKDWTVAADVTKKYKLEVISLADGFKDYDEVEVAVKKYYLTGIAPNPADAQATISYTAAGAGSAYLVVVQPFGNTAYNYILDTGKDSYKLNTDELPAGVYNVILVCNGVIADAKSLQVN